MTIATHTGKTETRPCASCGTAVEHRESSLSCGDGGKPLWMPERHVAPCGLPCIGGGVSPKQIRGEGAHGYGDRCPKCGPLRVLPDVVAEMRGRGAVAQHWAETADDPYSTNDLLRESLKCSDGLLKRSVADLLLALDEIDKLRAELAETTEALHEARERATFARLELQEREIREEEHRGQPPLLSSDGPLRALSIIEGPIDREMCGKMVRSIWVEWAREQPSPKPSWLVPWEGLGEPDRDVDRRIGWALFDAGRESMRSEIEKFQQSAPRAPPVEWALLDEKRRAEASAWVREQVDEHREIAARLRKFWGQPEEAERLENIAASVLALIALPDAPSPLTPEQREMLGREAENLRVAEFMRRIRENAGATEDIGVVVAERMFLRGLGAGHDLLEAGQHLRRILVNEGLPRADRESPPGLQIAVGRIVGAVERLGDIPPDREPVKSDEPATWQEREEADEESCGECGHLEAEHRPMNGSCLADRCGCESFEVPQ